MTTQSATGFNLQDEGSVGVAAPRLGVAVAPARHALPDPSLRAVGAPRSRPGWRPLLQRNALAVADLISAAIALAVLDQGLPHVDAAALVAVAPLVMLLGVLARHYARHQLRVLSSTLDEAPSLLTLTGLCALTIAIAQPLFVDSNLSGPEIALVWGALFAAVVGGRMLARTAVRRATPVERCLVIGDAGQATTISNRFQAGANRATVVAVLPLASGDIEAAADLGDPDSMGALVREIGADRIILAPGELGDSTTANLVRAAKSVGVRVSLAPGILDVIGPSIEFDEVNGLPLLGVHPFGLSPGSRAVKRAFDLVLTAIGGIMISPVLLVIALAIRLDSDGPIFFCQTRVGRDGRRFRIIKFRSMVANADSQKDSLRQLSEVGDGMFKITDDPRVTRVGRFLRRSSLDELPQIFNVLRGEMSLVGPRPLVVEEDNAILGLDRSRLSLDPGMTGPWQVLPTRLPQRDMVQIDYRYADNWSLWLDLKILVRTALHVLRRGNH